MLKGSYLRVDISKYRPGEDHSAFLWRLSYDGCLAGSRSAPLTPDRVASLLAQEKKFYASSDVATVAGLYKTFFDAVVPNQKDLALNKLGWGDDDAALLSEVLTCFCQLEKLDLSENRIGPAGAMYLSARVVLMASITQVLPNEETS